MEWMGRKRMKEGNEKRRDQRDGKRCKRRGERGERRGRECKVTEKGKAARGKRVVVGYVEGETR